MSRDAYVFIRQVCTENTLFELIVGALFVITGVCFIESIFYLIELQAIDYEPDIGASMFTDPCL